MMKKLAVFHLISKHSLNINFLCIFNELLMSLRSAHSGSLGSSRDPDGKLVARGAVETAYDCSTNFVSAREDPVKV